MKTINFFDKQNFVLFFVLIFLTSIANASEIDEIQNGEQLVKSRISCSILNDELLENIGEYYMELMHPGQLHELMDERMGGEGSESLRRAHINIAKMMYCGDRNALPQNMMNIMMNRNSFGGGMMGFFGNGLGMMSYYPTGLFFGGFMMLFWIIIIILIIYILFRIVNGRDFPYKKRK